MNQILLSYKTKKYKKNIYIIQFLLTFSILLVMFFYHILDSFTKLESNKKSKITSKQYTLTKLYQTIPNNTITINNTLVHILCKIEIPKINVSYLVFDTWSDYLLKLSICKLYGPDLNQSGNICVWQTDCRNVLCNRQLVDSVRPPPKKIIDEILR